MAQCSLLFELRPSSYSTDKAKVLFVISRLSSPAFQWARSIISDSYHPLRSDYPAFRSSLQAVYSDRTCQITVMNKISSLCQTKSAATYTSEFMSLPNTLNLDNNAKLLEFQQGLSSELKRSPAISGVPPTIFETYMQRAIEINQGTFLAGKSKQQSTGKTTSFNHSSTSNHGQRSHAPSSAPPPRNLKTSTSQLYRKITPEERKCRFDNKLCMYCVDPGCFVDQCLKRNNSNAPTQVPTPRQTSAPSLSSSPKNT